MEHTDFKWPWVRCALLLGLAFILFPASGQAQTLSLMAPTIANDNGVLTANFGVTVVEKPILKGELEDGVDLELKCVVKLFEVHDYWLDSTVSSAEFRSTLSFDRLNKEYVMTLPERSLPLRDKNIEELLRKGWSSIKTDLGPWSVLQKGERYSLRLITTMNEKDAPEGLSRFIYFWSWDAGVDNTFHLNFTF